MYIYETYTDKELRKLAGITGNSSDNGVNSYLNDKPGTCQLVCMSVETSDVIPKSKLFHFCWITS